jgi:hypothetical protein
VEIVVRTPAGRSRSFEVDRDDTVGGLTERAVARFVADDVLDPGRYGLGLLRGHRVVDLDPAATLRAERVRPGAVLHLLHTEPQVDG